MTRALYTTCLLTGFLLVTGMRKFGFCLVIMLLVVCVCHDWGSSVVTVDQHGEGGDSCQCDASCVSRWTKQEEVSELNLPGGFVECLCWEAHKCP